MHCLKSCNLVFLSKETKETTDYQKPDQREFLTDLWFKMHQLFLFLLDAGKVNLSS